MTNLLRVIIQEMGNNIIQINTKEIKMALRDEHGHYESKFEFPLWKLIEQRAEEKEISYVQAAGEVLPEYEKGIRYRDKEFEDACVQARQKELAELAERERRE